MKFVLPDNSHEQQAKEYIDEFCAHSSQINGAGGLNRFLPDNYDDWLEKLRRDIDLANIPAGRVPAITYFYVREEDGKIVGMINVRLAVLDHLGTHIGYSIRPTGGAAMQRKCCKVQSSFARGLACANWLCLVTKAISRLQKRF